MLDSPETRPWRTLACWYFKANQDLGTRMRTTSVLYLRVNNLMSPPCVRPTAALEFQCSYSVEVSLHHHCRLVGYLNTTSFSGLCLFISHFWFRFLPSESTPCFLTIIQIISSDQQRLSPYGFLCQWLTELVMNQFTSPHMIGWVGATWFGFTQ